MGRRQQQDGGAERAGKQDRAVPDAAAETDGADALNDARALQQMIEGTPDSSDEFRRIEQKR